jgi:hypothetical protein
MQLDVVMSNTQTSHFGRLTLQSERSGTAVATIHEPEPRPPGSVMASLVEAPVLGVTSVGIYGESDVQAFTLAQQLVVSLTASLGDSLRVLDDSGWSTAFVEKRKELQQLESTEQPANGHALYLKACDLWAVGVRPKQGATFSIAIVGPSQDHAQKAAAEFLSNSAK